MIDVSGGSTQSNLLTSLYGVSVEEEGFLFLLTLLHVSLNFQGVEIACTCSLCAGQCVCAMDVVAVCCSSGKTDSSSSIRAGITHGDAVSLAVNRSMPPYLNCLLRRWH